MTTASICIGKQVTVIIGSYVHTEKMGNFESVISEHNTVVVYGMSKPAKKAKYENLVLSCGFKLVEVSYERNAGFEGNNSDVIDYRKIYAKNN